MTSPKVGVLDDDGVGVGDGDIVPTGARAKQGGIEGDKELFAVGNGGGTGHFSASRPHAKAVEDFIVDGGEVRVADNEIVIGNVEDAGGRDGNAGHFDNDTATLS